MNIDKLRNAVYNSATIWDVEKQLKRERINFLVSAEGGQMMYTIPSTAKSVYRVYEQNGVYVVQKTSEAGSTFDYITPKRKRYGNYARTF